MSRQFPSTPSAPRTLTSLFGLALQKIFRPLWRAVNQWIEADGLRMSAAMSFYEIFRPLWRAVNQ